MTAVAAEPAATPLVQVQVWFGTTAIVDQTKPAPQAVWFAEAMRRKHPSLVVTTNQLAATDRAVGVEW